MLNKYSYYHKLGIEQITLSYIEKCEAQINPQFKAIDDIAEFNQLKVLHAMQENKLSDIHFNWNTGYGYDDIGRDAVENVYKTVFGAEDAIVRPIIVSGTHALTLMLTGILRPKQRMLSITGRPYDTLEKVIGLSKSESMSLLDIGVIYDEVPLNLEGSFDVTAIKEAMSKPTDVIYIQRSAGYAWRRGLKISEIAEVIKLVKKIAPNCIVMVDNCYGEFLDYQEPTEVGADLIAGSLIKNPGGGLALSGGYIVGKSQLIEQVAGRMTSPGIGKECGLTFGQTRPILQGLFMAPKVVSGALKGAILCAKVYETLGYKVNPSPEASRSDIIQAIEFGTPDKVISFCRGIQSASPIDSFVTPEPWAMPGYTSDVIMAAGAFVQGSSIELSADAPIRPPYIAYFQGGLTYEHSKFGVIKSLQTLQNSNLITI
ncbi:methionine gamma-lyase family protein [Fusibacter bizertensis]|uniref:Methionine gamma-lyase family protein n=1 Tax=Fusibacter bizertensis TaxID=1488331 RepID=A0ABT6N817_9FIRM|nr:methionine gamma-lyase family protein [Fusibacter bizertensis]MDH8676560.1 methionine gamma-lyase family protein [Fusibacter bizertensis]